MRMRNAFLVAVLAAVGAGLAGCPSTQSCPLETPKVDATPATCTEDAGQPVSYPVRLCPTCNLTGVSCAPNMSDVGAGVGSIFLDVKAESCSDPNSCGGAACQLNATTCNFTAPSTPGTYQVIVFDGATGQPITPAPKLVVIATGPENCALPPAAGL